MRNVCQTILSADDSVSQTSDKLDSGQWVSASFLASFGDATAAGTVKIQASNDPCPYGNLAVDFTPTNWADVPSATASVSSGASVLITIANCAYRWLRVVYTRSGGGSTLITVNYDALSI